MKPTILQRIHALIEPVQIGFTENPKGAEPLYLFYCTRHGYVTDIEHSGSISCPRCLDETLENLKWGSQ